MATSDKLELLRDTKASLVDALVKQGQMMAAAAPFSDFPSMVEAIRTAPDLCSVGINTAGVAFSYAVSAYETGDFEYNTPGQIVAKTASGVTQASLSDVVCGSLLVISYDPADGVGNLAAPSESFESVMADGGLHILRVTASKGGEGTITIFS